MVFTNDARSSPSNSSRTIRAAATVALQVISSPGSRSIGSSFVSLAPETAPIRMRQAHAGDINTSPASSIGLQNHPRIRSLMKRLDRPPVARRCGARNSHSRTSPNRLQFRARRCGSHSEHTWAPADGWRTHLKAGIAAVGQHPCRTKRDPDSKSGERRHRRPERCPNPIGLSVVCVIGHRSLGRPEGRPLPARY